jgi:FKBP-type peptidyl-prolyl cis-trans isomerase
MRKIYLFLAILATTITACQKDDIPEEDQINSYVASKNLTVTEKTASGLRYIVTKANPTGAALKAGQTINVNYAGTFLSGKSFDSGNFSFVLGAGRVVKGFDEGIAKMKVGEKATIIFPSTLGYGPDDYSGIPGGSPLVFDIEVVSAR